MHLECRLWTPAEASSASRPPWREVSESVTFLFILDCHSGSLGASLMVGVTDLLALGLLSLRESPGATGVDVCLGDVV